MGLYTVTSNYGVFRKDCLRSSLNLHVKERQLQKVNFVTITSRVHEIKVLGYSPCISITLGESLRVFNLRRYIGRNIQVPRLLATRQSRTKL